MKLDNCVKITAEYTFPDNDWMQLYFALQLQMDLDDFISHFHLEEVDRVQCFRVLFIAKFFSIKLY